MVTIMKSEVEFNPDNAKLVQQIAGRWRDLVAASGDEVPPRLLVEMDIRAANGVNGNPALDLEKLYRFPDPSFGHEKLYRFPDPSFGHEKLYRFPDPSFGHDMAGIGRHMDRSTGRVGGCFLPRCAISQHEGVV